MRWRFLSTTMKALISSSISMAPMFAGLSAASDDQDAVELLAYALNCPRKPMMWRQGSEISFFLAVQRSVGDARQLVIESEATYDNGTVARQTDKADYAGLKLSELQEEENYWNLYYFCLDGKACISEEIQGKDAGPTIGQIIHLCDGATAEYAKLAIDTLIRWNMRGKTVGNSSQTKAPAATTFKKTSKKTSGDDDIYRGIRGGALDRK
jgi:hypothetical protein